MDLRTGPIISESSGVLHHESRPSEWSSSDTGGESIARMKELCVCVFLIKIGAYFYRKFIYSLESHFDVFDMLKISMKKSKRKK